MLLAVLMVVLMYLLPTLAVLGVTNDTDQVTMGFYGHVAEEVRGLGGCDVRDTWPRIHFHLFSCWEI